MMKFTDLETKAINNAIKIIERKMVKKEFSFCDPDAVKRMIRMSHSVQDSDREVFRVLFLDNQHRLIKQETLFYGTIDASPVYPRVVAQKALENNAAAIILTHNHPSGVAEPSRADRSITERLTQALGLLDIRVLDHFVVGDGEIISFAERGWL